MPNIITDFETWLLGYGERVYRYLIYRRMFTPYEQKNAFMDDDFYEDSHYTMCKIEEAIDLGNGDWLLGMRDIEDNGRICGMMHYVKLSEIRLAYFNDDQSIELYEEDDP